VVDSLKALDPEWPIREADNLSRNIDRFWHRTGRVEFTTRTGQRSAPRRKFISIFGAEVLVGNRHGEEPGVGSGSPGRSSCQVRSATPGSCLDPGRYLRLATATSGKNAIAGGPNGASRAILLDTLGVIPVCGRNRPPRLSFARSLSTASSLITDFPQRRRRVRHGRAKATGLHRS
jgi:hypothetical protein